MIFFNFYANFQKSQIFKKPRQSKSTEMATEAQLQQVAELEIEMMSDMYRRMTSTCETKCISKAFKEAELTKGEATCLDRCVAKYLDVHERLGKKLTSMSQQDESALQKIAQGQ
ncbi:hypothetical protein WR25_04802 isoform B [Diploscapter pachys]|uniref:Mitochondrial import inner membrane translocase subunit n=1 Tax=Diploscapter pachys TaxID=2018661 RepID=A0A2A2LMY2_9BILA|nr:hypothetical protein WR25_04802 isoform B [Diploscapter pachys]